MLGEHASSGGERRTKAGSERSQSVKKLSAHTLTNIPEGELLTGFAMRSDPNVVFG